MTKTIRNLVMALVVTAGAAAAMTGPALAADWHGDRDARVHDWRHDRDTRAREWRNHHPVYFAAPYAYAPAPYAGYGYVAPPPVVAYAPPALSFNLNLPIR